MNRKPIRLALSVAANTDGTLTYTVREDCTLERIICNFPPGSEGDLRITPYISPPDRGPKIPILESDDAKTVNSYLSGDDYVLDLKINVPVKKHSQICVDYDNNDLVYAHFFDFVFEIDEMGGLSRVGGVN